MRLKRDPMKNICIFDIYKTVSRWSASKSLHRYKTSNGRTIIKTRDTSSHCIQYQKVFGYSF
jgi:hypothetical protein